METIADGKVIIQIDGDDKGFASKLQGIDNSASELASGALKGLAVGVAAVESAMAAGAAAAVAAGSAYETAFAKTETIMDTTVVSAQAMSAAIIDLSNDTGTAAKDLSNSVYDAISATGDTAHAVSLVADASKLATAGFAEQSDALGVLTTIMNAYGMEADQAQAISDSLIQTQNLGVTTVGQLASSMGKAIATASAYSVDLYNLESAYVSLTKAGISTEESTTYLSSMFNELGDAGSEVAGILKNKTGKSFGQLMNDGASLGDVLDILLQSVNGDTEALMNLWGSAEAGKASMAIAGQGVTTFNANLDNLRNSVGTTEKAYETMTQTLSFQTELLKTRITNLGTAVYSYFDDSLTAGVSSLSDAFLDLTASVTDGALSDDLAQIGAGLSSMIQSGSELAADVLPAVISGMAFLVEHGDALIAMLGGAVAAYGAYQAAATVATIATEGFIAALAINPIALAAAACIGLGTALGVLLSTVEETRSPIEELQSSIADNKAETEDLTEAIGTAIAKYREFKAETSSSTQNNAELIASLASLVENYDGTATSASEIQRIIEQLNSAIPDLNLEFDEQSGALNKTAEEMAALNKQYGAQSKYDAAVEYRTQALEEQESAISALATAKENQAKAQEDLNSFEEEHTHIINGARYANSGYEQSWKSMKDAVIDADNAVEQADAAVESADRTVEAAQHDVDVYGEAFNRASAAVDAFTPSTEASADSIDAQAQAAKEATQSIAQIGIEAYTAVQSGQNLRDTYEELRGKLDELKGTGDPYIESLAEQNLKMLEIAATAEELQTDYSDLAASVGVSAVNIAEALVGAGMSADEFASGCESMRDRVINSFNTISVNEELTASQIAANLATNLEIHNQWSNNLIALWNSTQDETVRAFILYLYDQGPELATAVAEFANGGTTELQAAAESWAAIGDSSAQGYLARVAGQAELAGATGTALSDTTVSGIDLSAFENSGTASTQSFASGMLEQIPVVEAATEEVAMAAHSTIATVGWTDLGDAIGQGIANGISSSNSLVSDAAKSVANNAASSIDISTFESTGTNAGKALSTGIKGQNSAVKASAQVLATTVTTVWTSFSGKFQQSGSVAGTRIRTGLLQQMTSIRSAGQTLATSVNTAWTATMGQFQRTGALASTTLAAGIGSGQYTVTSTASSVIYAAQSAMNIGGWYDLGYNISAGVASGVRGGSYLITQAAQAAAQNALASAKASLGVNSPSRVFRDEVGRMIPAGIALGIEKETPALTKSMNNTTDALLEKARAAVRPTVDHVATSYVTNNTIYNNGGTSHGSIVIEIPVNLDGREIARSTAKYTSQQMSYLEGL